MRDCCPANQFSGECEGRECQSYAPRLDDINRKIKLTEAKHRADRAVLTFIAILCIGFAAFSFGHALVKLDKQYQQEARV